MKKYKIWDEFSTFEEYNNYLILQDLPCSVHLGGSGKSIYIHPLDNSDVIRFSNHAGNKHYLANFDINVINELFKNGNFDDFLLDIISKFTTIYENDEDQIINALNCQFQDLVSDIIDKYL